MKILRHSTCLRKNETMHRIAAGAFVTKDLTNAQFPNSQFLVREQQLQMYAPVFRIKN
jgi:hypothetical protein